MINRNHSKTLGLLVLVSLLFGCNSGGNLAEESVSAPSTEVTVDYNCPSGSITTAVYSISDLSSYVVHNWDYLERSEGAQRELYSEEIAAVTLKDGKVADTDSAFTIYFDTFHKSDWVRVNGQSFVRHNEGSWESIAGHDWEITADGLMGDGPLFYDNLYKVSWVRSGPKPEDSYCELKQVDFKGTSAWQMTFHNVPQWVFQSGFGGRRSGANGYQAVQDRLRDGWVFQSADYSATVIDLYSSPRLVAESVRTKIGDISGDAMYITWETDWSNFNEPVTIRRPEQ